MAKRRKSKPTRRRSSRRMGAIGGSMITDVLGTIAGAFVAKKIQQTLSFDDKVKNGIVLGAGIFLPKFVKNPMVKSVANGMTAIGGLGLAGSFFPQLGAVDEDYILVSGADSDEVNVVNGMEYENIPAVNGEYSDDLALDY